MRKTTEYADSIYDLLRPKVMRLFNNRGSFLKHFRALAECSILGSIIVYFVGTTILLLRNLLSGLPFVPLSIIQAAVITVYFCVFVVAYIVVEHIVCKMWRKKRESISFWRKVGCVFCLIIVVAACMLISVAILWLFLRNAILPLLLIVSFFYWFHVPWEFVIVFSKNHRIAHGRFYTLLYLQHLLWFGLCRAALADLVHKKLLIMMTLGYAKNMIITE